MVIESAGKWFFILLVGALRDVVKTTSLKGVIDEIRD